MQQQTALATTATPPHIYPIRYNKRKTRNIFKKLDTICGMTDVQNYNPLLCRLFALNSDNYNIITLDHPWVITDVYPAPPPSVTEDDDSLGSDPMKDNFIECALTYMAGTGTGTEKQKTIRKEIFAKFVPLVNVSDYVCGKFMGEPHKLALPTFAPSNIQDIATLQAYDKNHVAYTDNFFVYLSGLLHSKGFVNGVEYYGSFVGNKRDFKYNITDEFDNLYDNKKFRKYNGVLYNMDEFDYLFHDQLVPIDDTVIALNDVFSDFDDDDDNETHSRDELDKEAEQADIEEQAEKEKEKEEEKEEEEDGNTPSSNDDDAPSSNSNSNTESETETDISFEDIYITIPSYPVQMICMEAFEDTLETTVFEETIKYDTPQEQKQWFAMLMQIIMTLITYQRCFEFTHNDLHTNNVMYIPTEQPYLYYTYAGKHYRVPTYGRIYKIIDFGRAIYTFNHQRYCSNEYAREGGAETLYNTEPYYLPDKPRIDPNYGFDLTRLATTLFDFVLTKEDDHICNADTIEQCTNPVKRLVAEWCLDDRGKNVLFKSSGIERYPDFKLYKMIVRTAHAHTPDAQLVRPEFSQFEIDDVAMRKIRARVAQHGVLLLGHTILGDRRGAQRSAGIGKIKYSTAVPVIMDIDRLIEEFRGPAAVMSR